MNFRPGPQSVGRLVHLAVWRERPSDPGFDNGSAGSGNPVAAGAVLRNRPAYTSSDLTPVAGPESCSAAWRRPGGSESALFAEV
jgi:hypothetical protein